MFQEIKTKIKTVRKTWKTKLAREDVSLYRIFIYFTSYQGQKKIWAFVWKLFAFVIRKLFGLPTKQNRDYQIWIKKNFPDEKKLNECKLEIQEFSFQPKISILLPVYNAPIQFLKEAILSVQNQIYTNWELCISDDLSTNKEIPELLKYYAASDERIKLVFRTQNGHISENSNSALKLASGEFIGLLDHDDCLSPDALFQNIKLLNKEKEIDLIYSDEDKIDMKGNYVDPHFKPDWCPDNFLSRNYICHFCIIKKSIVDEVGGFRKGFEGSQDYDLLLRVTEKTKKIAHISMIIYHWRIHIDSTSHNNDSKPYAFVSAVKALEEALIRRKIKGTVSFNENAPGYYHIRYEIFNKGKVSIVIPSKDKADLCEVILNSIFKLTDYTDFEVILVNNNSTEESFFEMIKRWEYQEPSRFRCLNDNGDFNYSRLINNGAKASVGEYLLLMNNDMKIIHSDWMTAMVEQAQFEATGAVGAKLLYPNDTIQHAGVIIGMGFIAGHCFVGFEKNDQRYFSYVNLINNFSAVTAACLMIRKKIFNEVGGFDEQFAVEYNDVDFCLKIKDLGYNNIWLPHVNVYHYESISRGHPQKTKKSYKQHLHDAELFKSRWAKYIKHDPCYNPHLSRLFNDFRLNIND